MLKSYLIIGEYMRTILFTILFFVFGLTVAAAQETLSVKLNPDKVYIIKSNNAQHINCDFYFEYSIEDTLELFRIELRVFNKNNSLIINKYLAYQGLSPSILTIPNRTLSKDNPICVYNPFYLFSPDLLIETLEFKFIFVKSDWDTKIEKTITVKPKYVESKTVLVLPIKSVLLIRDGNDFYSHHRRMDLTHMAAKMLGIKKHSNRFAYDFCPTNEKQETYKNKGELNKEWYGFGANIYAPAGGTVVEAFNDAIDSKIGQIAFEYKEAIKDNTIMMGNYVIIDHHNGEYSTLMHMKRGSLSVKVGDRVEQGQILGQIGDSGDSFIPHLHYQLTNGIDIMNSEGIPIYFNNFQRVQGSKIVAVNKGYLETGEIVKSK